MTNLLIISIYDSGWDFSIWYDNEKHIRGEDELADVIYDKLYGWTKYDEFINYLKSLDFDTIFICEDGDIVKVK